MDKLNIGILGCANVAKKHAIPAFKALEIAELRGIASRDKEKAKKWAKEFSIPFSGNYDELINNKEIDAVYIALPTGLNEKWVIKAANEKNDENILIIHEIDWFKKVIFEPHHLAELFSKNNKIFVIDCKEADIKNLSKMLFLVQLKEKN